MDNGAYYIRLRKKKDRKQVQVGKEKYLNGKCIESEKWKDTDMADIHKKMIMEKSKEKT